MSRFRWGLVVLALVGIGSLAFVAGSQVGRSVAIPDEGPWVILVETGSDRYPECTDDPAVDYDQMTADLPSTRSSVHFVPEAERSDVERVAGCIDRKVRARVTVVTRSAGD